MTISTYDTSRSCQWCGTGVYHSGVCPKVKRLEYNQYGQIVVVEFYEHGAGIGGDDEHPIARITKDLELAMAITEAQMRRDAGIGGDDGEER